MLFCHIVDDYYFQGILAQMKQKKWWEQNAPQKMYRYDYICALVEHAFSWSFMIHLPVFLSWMGNFLNTNPVKFVVSFSVNWIIHAVADDIKANKLKINLCVDQIIHVMQIAVTWIVFTV